MSRDWTALSNDAQLQLAREALLRAGEMIAHQAECLAGEIEHGALTDQGGPEALRLLAALIRTQGEAPTAVMGHA